MFTALHREANGNETIWNCSHVRKFQEPRSSPDGFTGYGPGVMLDLVPEGNVFFPMDMPKSEAPWKPSGAFIAVMNEHGKTVAKYDL